MVSSENKLKYRTKNVSFSIKDKKKVFYLSSSYCSLGVLTRVFSRKKIESQLRLIQDGTFDSPWQHHHSTQCEDSLQCTL